MQIAVMFEFVFVENRKLEFSSRVGAEYFILFTPQSLDNGQPTLYPFILDSTHSTFRFYLFRKILASGIIDISAFLKVCRNQHQVVWWFSFPSGRVVACIRPNVFSIVDDYCHNSTTRKYAFQTFHIATKIAHIIATND